MPVGTITFPTTIDSAETLAIAANNLTVMLDAAITAGQTTIPVADVTNFPVAGFATIVDSLTTPTKIEIISYTGSSGNSLTGVVRGAQGTTAQAFTSGYVEMRPTAAHHNALVDAVIAIENRLGTGSVLSLAKGGTGTAFTSLPASDRIFFWDASANQMALLQLGTNLSITGTTLNATGGGTPPASFDAISLIMPDMYTVTPGTLTPGVFTTFTVTFNAQQKNKVLAAPTNSTDVPTFRLLTDADIPNALTITQFASVTSNGFVKTTNSDGTLTIDTNTYVTSVGLSLPNIFTVTNSPVTSSGTLTATLATQAENLVLVGPINAPAATPTFRLLEDEDIPNVLSIHKNRHLTTNGFVKTTNGDGTYAVDTNTYLTGNQTVTLSGDVTGSGATSITTTIANGAVTYAKLQNLSATSRILGRKTAGAGSAEELTLSDVLDFVGSAAQGDILYRGASSWTRLAAGTNGQYLQTQGAGANPQWATVVAGGTGADPSATIGLTAINGSASTFLRSDGAPALSQAIAPTWTANHSWNLGANGTTVTNGLSLLSGASTANDQYSPAIYFRARTSSTFNADYRLYAQWNALQLQGANTNDSNVWNNVAEFSRESGITRLVLSRNTFNGSVTVSDNDWGLFVRTVSSQNLVYLNTTSASTNACAFMGGGSTLLLAAKGDNSGVGVNLALASIAAQLHVVSGSASRVGLRVDSAASPSTHILQITNNGTNAFLVTSTGAPSAPGAGSTSERFGAAATADGYGGTAFGSASKAGSFCASLGNSARALADAAVAIGYGALVDTGNTASVAIGSSSNAPTANLFVAGSGGYPLSTVVFGKGYTHATPTAYSIIGTGGSGTNIAGANLNLAGGAGTGTGTGGSVNLRVALAGTTGSTANALTTVLTAAAVTNAVTITSPSASMVGLRVDSAASPTANILQVTTNGTNAFLVTSTGAPSGPGSASNSERYGANASATGNPSLAVGQSAQALFQDSTAVGPQAYANKWASVALGNFANAVAVGAVAINCYNDVANSFSCGSGAANGFGTANITTVVFGNGHTNSTPVAYAIIGTGGSGTDIAGANLNLAGGAGTGTGIPGTIGMQFARAGTTGSTANALSDEWRASYSTTDTVSLTAALKTSTTNLTEAARLSAIWTTATHASRTAKWQLQLVGNAAALATVAEFDMSTTAGDTRFLIYDVDNATLERVTVGAADSGGTGFKVLRIPN